MKPYLFKIGGFELRIYSLMYILAFLFGMFIALADDVAEKRGVDDRKIIEDFAFTTIVAGLIGARLYYVIFKFSFIGIKKVKIVFIYGSLSTIISILCRIAISFAIASPSPIPFLFSSVFDL